MKLTLTSIEQATGTPVIRSEVWQREEGFTWRAWHPFSDWTESGGPTRLPSEAYDQIYAAVREAMGEMPSQGVPPPELRVIRVHYDA